MFETDKIRIELSKPENLPIIVQIEKDNPELIGQYDLKRHLSVIENENEGHYSVFDKSDNSLIGHIILAGLTDPNDSIEFRRIVISKKGFGYGKDAIRMMVRHCFKELKVHRIWLDVLSDNFRAIRLYQSLGFKKEGLLRDCLKQNGSYRSLWIMSLLALDSIPSVPIKIDHVCIIVKDLEKTKIYFELLFGLEIRAKPDSVNVLMCENQYIHFFVKQMDLSPEFLKEQHLSLEVENIDWIKNQLIKKNILFETGEFIKFQYNNYKWIEWNDPNGIRFECIERL